DQRVNLGQLTGDLDGRFDLPLAREQQADDDHGERGQQQDDADPLEDQLGAGRAGAGEGLLVAHRLRRYATSCSSSTGVSCDVVPCRSAWFWSVKTASRSAAEPSCRYGGEFHSSNRVGVSRPISGSPSRWPEP